MSVIGLLAAHGGRINVVIPASLRPMEEGLMLLFPPPAAHG